MVTIVVRLQVEVEGKTLAEVEAEVMGQLRGALGPALETEVARVAEAAGPGSCRECGQPRRGRGWERRRIVGLFGVLEVRRQRAECVRCRITGYPVDEVLGLEAQERYSLGVAEAALWLAVDGSYAKSAASMRKLLGVPISAPRSTIWPSGKGSWCRRRGSGCARRCSTRGTGRHSRSWRPRPP